MNPMKTAKNAVRNIRDTYKRNKKRAKTGSVATKSKYSDNDHLKFLDASLAERESQCTIKDNEGEESTQCEENEVNTPSSAQKESENEASKILKSKPIRNECTTSNEITINQQEVGALNENYRVVKINERKLILHHTQIWNQVNKNQTEGFEVIKSLLQKSNETENVENKVWQKQ